MKKSNKFIALFLIFSLLQISCATLKSLEQKREEKRKKHGAYLVILNKNGQVITGELLYVKEDLLFLQESEADLTVDIKDVRVITIKKKSKALSGAAMGLLVGAGSGVIMGIFSYEFTNILLLGFAEELGADTNVAQAGVVFGILGLITGGIVGSVMGKDKKIQIEGMTDMEIRKAIEKLRKKARIPDYK